MLAESRPVHYSLGVGARLALGLVLCWLAQRVYALTHRREHAAGELTRRENAAYAAALGGYVVGVLFAVGAPLLWARGAPLSELPAAAGWGALDIVLINVASLVKRRLVLRRLSLSAQVHRGNLSAGILAGGTHLANGLLVYGAVGPERGLAHSLALWAYGQVWLSAAAALLPFALRSPLWREIERDNRAVAWSAAGALVACANLMRLALTGEFWGWADSFVAVSTYAALGLSALLLVTELLDLALLRGVSLRRELIERKEPNAGLGFLLAAVWVGSSLLAGWCL